MFAIQQEWSLFARDLEAELVPTCKELGIQIVAYSPIARGMLSGALTEAPKDWRATVPYFTAENIEANRRLVTAIETLASSKGVTPAQICLAWVIKKGGIPIPGTTKEERAGSNHESVRIDMTDADMAALEALGDQVKGLRGDESYMSRTFHAN
jgi:aryl-alcohol dehydrogenase-like predicted oxidoreductase